MGIYWLASYPKSGNTWLRAFLLNYQYAIDAPIGINELRSTNVVDRELFDEYLGIDSSDLSPEQIDCYRPMVYARMVSRQPSPVFLKTHAPYSRNARGQAIFETPVTKGAVYLIRNPLDIAVSYASHEGRTVDAIIARMADPLANVVDASSGNLPEALGSWSGHVQSWLDQAECATHLVRYEDLIARPFETFAAIVEFAGLECEPDRVRKALAFSSFDRMKAQESASGFIEKPPRASSFFREGRAGSWRGVLRSEQVRRVFQDQGPTMARFGYAIDPSCVTAPVR